MAEIIFNGPDGRLEGRYHKSTLKDAPQHVDISMQNRSFWRPRGPELCPAPCRRVPNLDKCPRGHLAKFRKIEVGMWKGR